MKNSMKFEILVLEMNYVDGLGGPIVNEMTL